MIINIDRLVEHIADYISGEIKSANKNGVVIPVSGGLNSTVAAVLCKQANIPFFAFHLWYDTGVLESCHETLKPDNVDFAVFEQKDNKDIFDYDDCLESFRAGIVGAFCNNYSNKHNYLVLGDLCRTKSNLVRRYIKRFNDSADIYPFADLYNSELLQIAKDIVKYRGDMPWRGTSELHPKNIAHEERLHLTFSDIEWADKENLKNHIFDFHPVNSTPLWYKYTLIQKEVLSRIQQIEMRTRHKKLWKPVLRLRNNKGMVE